MMNAECVMIFLSRWGLLLLCVRVAVQSLQCEHVSESVVLRWNFWVRIFGFSGNVLRNY
jgi:hypothetical protein